MEPQPPVDPPSANGAPPPGGLPPVTPPSAGFILQLFLVPGILVALIVGFIWVFFGSRFGGGPQTPEQFIKGLKSTQELERWKTAEHLAQVLKRDEKLAGNAAFALELAEILQTERQRELKPANSGDGRDTAPDLAAEFLPAALGSFHVPVAVPLYRDMIEENLKPALLGDLARRKRLRNAVWALALLGENMNRRWSHGKDESLPPAVRAEIIEDLRPHAGPADGGRAYWARLALDYLQTLENPPGRDAKPAETPELIVKVMDALERGAAAPDEMTRKFTILALVVWETPQTEKLLMQLARAPNPDLLYFEDDRDERSKECGRREIRYNAALALIRRSNARLTDDEKTMVKDLVLDALNEPKQREYYTGNEGVAYQVVQKALKDVGRLREIGLAKQGPLLPPDDADIRAAVDTLAKSDNAAVSVEAKRVLGLTGDDETVAAKLSRHGLLIGGLAGGIVLLLGLAVFARWRRAPVPSPQR